MKFRDFTKMLREAGWQFEKQEGSHQKWIHPDKSSRVTVAGHPNDDIPAGTLKAMLRQAGLK
jgi:predicted RNA binding protein YcfA (HicA-like mRNA interferase family)